MNPCDAVKAPTFTTPEMHTWTGEQMGAFITHVREHAPQWTAFFTLAASSGARRGEVVPVQWQDLDLTPGRGTWRVRRSAVTARSTVFVNEPKTRAGRRSIQLDNATVAALAEHRRYVAESALALGRADACGPTGAVFPPWAIIFDPRASAAGTSAGSAA